MVVWAEWFVLLNLDRPGCGTVSLGMMCTPPVIWGESQRTAIIGEDDHLALTLAPGRLSW